jgi:nicotinamide riboside kinase
VVVTGAESTGKSSLAVALASALGVPLSLEFSRAHAESVQRLLTAADAEPIARGQRAHEDAALVRAGGGRCVFDTDLRSTLLYTRYYYGEATVAPWLREAVGARVPALYLLCDTDMPWIPDPVRDSPAARELLQTQFVASVGASGAPVVVMRGSLADRLVAAREAVARFVP